MRWQVLLVKFDLEIIHKKGKLHTLPDTINRIHQIHHIVKNRRRIGTTRIYKDAVDKHKSATKTKTRLTS